MRQMTDYDNFTKLICGGDPVKMQTIERGNMRTRWGVAEDYMTKLVHAKEANDRAEAKRPVLSPRMKRRG